MTTNRLMLRVLLCLVAALLLCCSRSVPGSAAAANGATEDWITINKEWVDAGAPCPDS